MSASLVGSEMCIRDSPSPLLGSRPGGPAGPAGGDSGWGRGFRRLLLVPVSYTHLTLPTICSV
eukprot:4019562-Alexandrium_andersonii.AAC.1